MAIRKQTLHHPLIWIGILLALLPAAGCAPTRSVQATRPMIFYPAPPEEPRLQYLHTISIEAHLGRERSAFDQFLLGAAPAGQMIGRPYDIASAPGKIYVLDRLTKKLRIIDLEGRRISDMKDDGLGALQDPSGIWVTQDNVKYITDMRRRQVVMFDAQDRFIGAYGDKETFDRPVDVAVYQNRLYVCDMKRNEVVVLDRHTQQVVQRIGGKGADQGAFRMPTHAVVDGRGHLFVTDAFNFRVQQFTADGKFIKAFGSLGDTLGSFARPKGLAVDRSGHLYVADAAFENVQIFDRRSGNLLLFFGGSGTGPGQMYLPAGIHIDYDNAPYFSNYTHPRFKLSYLVYVANNYGPNRINIYGFGTWMDKE